MLNLSQKSKIIIYPIMYWLIFFIAPVIIAYIYRSNELFVNISGMMIFFVIFIAPFFYFIPYKMILFENKRQKLHFILLGLMLPYVIFISSLFYKIIENFNNSRFSL
jgi:hypothetical protein